MKVSNMTSSSGNPVANQFIVRTGYNEKIEGVLYRGIEYFQSYDSIIAKKAINNSTGNSFVFIDSKYWDYSATTRKYRNLFLGETKKETQAKIDSGEYILTNLNEG